MVWIHSLIGHLSALDPISKLVLLIHLLYKFHLILMAATAKFHSRSSKSVPWIRLYHSFQLVIQKLMN